MASYITVKGPGKDNKVILWEKSPEHPTSDDNPDGEIFIVNDGKSYTVGETAAVQKLLMNKRLVKADGSTRASATPPTASKTDDKK